MLRVYRSLPHAYHRHIPPPDSFHLSSILTLVAAIAIPTRSHPSPVRGSDLFPSLSMYPRNGAYLPRHNSYHGKMGAKVNHMSTRRRNMYIKWVIIAVLLMFFVYNWRSTTDQIQAISPYEVDIKKKPTTPNTAANQAAAAVKDAAAKATSTEKKEEDSKQKIAIVTFTTSEKSYTYLSLKNKHGAFPCLHPCVQ